MRLKNEFKNILVVTLSNIGDVVLTLPIIDTLLVNFPSARLSIITSRQVKELFENNPNVKEVIIYNKKASIRKKLRLVSNLRKRGYDLILDLRNSLFPYLIGAPCRSSIFCRVPAGISHMGDRHLWKLKSVIRNPISVIRNQSTWIRKEDERYVSQFLKDNGVKENDRLVGVSPGARSHTKRWKKDGFGYVCERLAGKDAIKVVMIGDKEELPLAREIASELKNKPIITCGQTSLLQLFSLINHCSLLISNDTAPMHIGSYLNVPVVAIFGPTNPKKYSPQGENDIVIRKKLKCSPCERALCKFNHECIELISVDEVFAAADRLLESKNER